MTKNNEEETTGKQDLQGQDVLKPDTIKIKLPKKVKWEIIGSVVATVIVKATILLALGLPGDKLIGGGTIIRYFIVYFIIETYYRKNIETKYANTKNIILLTFGVFLAQTILGEIILTLVAN